MVPVVLLDFFGHGVKQNNDSNCISEHDLEISGFKQKGYLAKLDKAAVKLKLFKSVLLDFDSLCPTLTICNRFFYVAYLVPPSTVPNPVVELVEHVVNGTLVNACSKASVKLVVISSGGVLFLKSKWPKGKVQDKNCWIDKNYYHRTTYTWYCYSKAITDSEALEWAKKSGFDILTICPAYIFWLMLQGITNDNSLVLIKYLKDISILVLVEDLAAFEHLFFSTLEKSKVSKNYFHYVIGPFFFSNQKDRFVLATSEVFAEMLESSDVLAFVELVAINKCGRVITGKRPFIIKELYGIIMRDSIELFYVVSDNYLVDKDGRLFDTPKLWFSQIGARKILCSWHPMTMGLVGHKICFEVLHLFNEMLRDFITPNNVPSWDVIIAAPKLASKYSNRLMVNVQPLGGSLSSTWFTKNLSMAESVRATLQVDDKFFVQINEFGIQHCWQTDGNNERTVCYLSLEEVVNDIRGQL